MKKTPLRVLALLVALLGITASMSLTNVALATNFATSTTFNFTDHPTGTADKFTGTVTTTGGPVNCVKNRQVKVFKGNVSSATQIGNTVLTDAAGNWTRSAQDPNKPQISPSKGFYAKVVEKILGNSDVCDAYYFTPPLAPNVPPMSNDT